MGTATNSPPVIALEKKHLTRSELAGCTRFFATFISTTGARASLRKYGYGGRPTAEAMNRAPTDGLEHLAFKRRGAIHCAREGQECRSLLNRPTQ